MAPKSEWTDAELLRLLELRDLGLTLNEIARRLRRSRGSVIGMHKRLNDEADRCFPRCDAEGTLPRGWWKAGLAARGEAVA